MPEIVIPNYMNFSWLIENQLAGHRGIQSAEHLQFLRDKGIKALIRLTQVPRVKPADIAGMGMLDYYLSIPDMSAPSLTDIDRMIAFIEDCLLQDKPVGVSCDGGYGRTGCLLSCFFITRGMDASKAIGFIKEKRPGSVLTEEQDRTVHQFAEHHRKGDARHK